MPDSRYLIYVRIPKPSEPELIIVHDGRTLVVPLDRNQTDNLAIQFVRAAIEWPHDHHLQG